MLSAIRTLKELRGTKKSKKTHPHIVHILCAIKVYLTLSDKPRTRLELLRKSKLVKKNSDSVTLLEHTHTKI